MSTRCAGAAKRMFRMGSRLCPPASTLPSPPTRASSANASATEAGADQANGDGFTLRILAHVRAGGEQPPPAQQPARRSGGSPLAAAPRAAVVLLAVLRVVDDAEQVVRDQGHHGAHGDAAE